LSRMNLSEYVGHVTVFRRMYTIEVLHSSRDRVTISVKIRVTCSVWLVRCYASAFILLSVVIVTLPAAANDDNETDLTAFVR